MDLKASGQKDAVWPAGLEVYWGRGQNLFSNTFLSIAASTYLTWELVDPEVTLPESIWSPPNLNFKIQIDNIQTLGAFQVLHVH